MDPSVTFSTSSSNLSLSLRSRLQRQRHGPSAEPTGQLRLHVMALLVRLSTQLLNLLTALAAVMLGPGLHVQLPQHPLFLDLELGLLLHLLLSRPWLQLCTLQHLLQQWGQVLHTVSVTRLAEVQIMPPCSPLHPYPLRPQQPAMTHGNGLVQSSRRSSRVLLMQRVLPPRGPFSQLLSLLGLLRGQLAVIWCCQPAGSCAQVLLALVMVVVILSGEWKGLQLVVLLQRLVLMWRVRQMAVAHRVQITANMRAGTQSAFSCAFVRLRLMACHDHGLCHLE